jgi:hypothetical protein
MQGGEAFRTLLSFLDTVIDNFPDVRRGKNTQYSMRDILMAGLCDVLLSESVLPGPLGVHAASARHEQRQDNIRHTEASYR